MTGTNEFLPFATGTGANVLDQGDYDALPARDGGFSSGIARSIELNKVWRQASVISWLIGQFTANHSGADAADDGDLETLLARFEAALSAALGDVSGFAPISNSVHIGTDTGAANAMVATFSPSVSALADGLFFEITPAAANTGATTLNANGLGATAVVRNTGAALTAGDIQAGAKTLLAYDGTLGKFVLLTPHLGSLANYVLKAGDTMLGALTLAGAPTSNLHAATKKYVDDLGATLADYLLKSGGTMTGSLTLSGAPTSALHAATKAYVDAVSSALANYLLKSGGTMTGALTLNADPTSALHAATKAYVDSYTGDIYNLGNLGGSATAYTASSSQPLMPTAGPRDGAIGFFTVGTTNSGTNPTLAVTGGTARDLRRYDGTNIVAGDLIANHKILARYDASVSRWWCLLDLTTGRPVGITSGATLLASGTSNYTAGATMAVIADVDKYAKILIEFALVGLPTAAVRNFLINLSNDGGSTYPTAGQASIAVTDSSGTHAYAGAVEISNLGMEITQPAVAQAAQIVSVNSALGASSGGLAMDGPIDTVRLKNGGLGSLNLTWRVWAF